MFSSRATSPPIQLTSTWQRADLLEKAWALPVAKLYAPLLSQGFTSLCGPTSVANVLRSLGVKAKKNPLKGFGFRPMGLEQLVREAGEVVPPGWSVSAVRPATVDGLREELAGSNDTSPTTPAQLAVVAGVLWRRSGRLALAEQAFRLALKRLPMHVGAMEQLAELLQWQGKSDEAGALYEKLTTVSKDPEFKDAFGALLRNRGEFGRAAELQRIANQDYAERVRLFPEAMFWHAAKHYRTVERDPKKADALLQQNSVIRPNARSLAVLAEAQSELGDNVNARRNIERALATENRSARLLLAASRVYAGLGEFQNSQRLATQASAANPMIASLPESAD
jgi:Tfp pilus assembly protein PilF